jgi:hypothetical protein
LKYKNESPKDARSVIAQTAGKNPALFIKQIKRTIRSRTVAVKMICVTVEKREKRENPPSKIQSIMLSGLFSKKFMGFTPLILFIR